MDWVIGICCFAGFLSGAWEMYKAKKNYSEECDSDSDSEESFSRNTKGFDRGYYRQRRGMFDNFK